MPIAGSDNQSLLYSRCKWRLCKRCQLTLWKHSSKAKIRVAVLMLDGLECWPQVPKPLIYMWWASSLEIFWSHWHLQNKSFSTGGRSLQYVLKHKKKMASAAPTQAYQTHCLEWEGSCHKHFAKRFLWIVIIITNIFFALYGWQSAPNLRCHFRSSQRGSSQYHLGGVEMWLSGKCQKMAISSCHVPNLCSSKSSGIKIS